MASPTSRSLALLREMGYATAVVEFWNAHSKRREDLFGALDILAIHPEYGHMYVQATTGDNMSKRLRKCREVLAGHPILKHAKVQVWGWRKLKKEGWQVRREDV